MPRGPAAATMLRTGGPRGGRTDVAPTRCCCLDRFPIPARRHSAAVGPVPVAQRHAHPAHRLVLPLRPVAEVGRGRQHRRDRHFAQPEDRSGPFRDADAVAPRRAGRRCRPVRRPWRRAGTGQAGDESSLLSRHVGARGAGVRGVCRARLRRLARLAIRHALTGQSPRLARQRAMAHRADGHLVVRSQQLRHRRRRPARGLQRRPRSSPVPVGSLDPRGPADLLASGGRSTRRRTPSDRQRPVFRVRVRPAKQSRPLSGMRLRPVRRYNRKWPVRSPHSQASRCGPHRHFGGGADLLSSDDARHRHLDRTDRGKPSPVAPARRTAHGRRGRGQPAPFRQ